MKTKLLSAAMLLTNIMAFSQTTVAIPDPAFEAYLETAFAANITPDGSTTDGSITFTDIDLITDIDLPTAGVTTVTDITGVKSFIKLKNLYVQDNALTGTVDVSGLDKLTNLYFYNNTGVTAVNISGCKVIYHIKGYGCSLESLDASLATTQLTDPTRLRYVYVNDNLLTSINVSGNTGIQRLDCFNNNLTSLDITGFTTLTYLRFQNNAITGSLDVSGNLSLEKLGAFGNDLTNIDLGAIPYTSFTYFKISTNNNLSCVYTANASDFAPGGPLETAIGSNYSVGTNTNFVLDATECATLGTEDFNAFEFSMYPNPTKEHVTISLNDNASYQLINMNGQTLMKGHFNAGKNPLSISNLARGLYFINMTTTNGNRMTHKLIKQ